MPVFFYLKYEDVDANTTDHCHGAAAERGMVAIPIIGTQRPSMQTAISMAATPDPTGTHGAYAFIGKHL